MAVTVLSGCANARSSTTDETSPITAQAEPQTETSPSPEPTPKPPSFSYTTDTYTAVYADTNGYKQTITVTIGPVIPGSASDNLAAAWSQVGGTSGSTPPCMDVDPTGSGNTNFVLKSPTAGYALGTVTITNDTTGFPAQDWTYQFVGLNWDGSAMGAAFSNGARCNDLHGGFLMTPSWKGNQWGPVPVAIAVNEYLSPAHPDGDPAKIAAPMSVRSYSASTSQGISFSLKPLPST